MFLLHKIGRMPGQSEEIGGVVAGGSHERPPRIAVAQDIEVARAGLGRSRRLASRLAIRSRRQHEPEYQEHNAAAAQHKKHHAPAIEGDQDASNEDTESGSNLSA